MSDGVSRHSKPRSPDNNDEDQPQETLQLFCQQITDYASQQVDELDTTGEPIEEMSLLFEELKMRNKLAHENYNFDTEMPRTIFQSLRVHPWLYTDITGLWILKDSGVPILSLNWRQNLDEFEIAGFFGAVSSFAKHLGHELHEIILEGIRVLFLREPTLGLIFSLAAPASSMPTSQGLSLLSEVRNAFLSRYQHYFERGGDIIITTEFADFSDHLIDLIVRVEFEIYLKTGIIRVENPLLFQLAKRIMSCKERDLQVLELLGKDYEIALSVQKISKKTAIPESAVRRSLQVLENLGLVRRFRDGRSYKYASDLQKFLYSVAADPNIHRLTGITIEKLLELIDSQIAKE
jgi:predicted transcriptional regulator